MADNLDATLPAQAAAGAAVATEIAAVSTTTGTDNYLTRAVLIPPPGFATVTGVATNNVTFNVRSVRAGGAPTTLASLTLNAGTNLVAETPVVVPVTATQAQQSSLAQDDVLDCQMVQNGTGLAVGAGIVCEVEIS